MKPMILAAVAVAAGLALPLAAQAHDPRPYYAHSYHYVPHYAPYYAYRPGHHVRGHGHHKRHDRHCRHDARRGHQKQWHGDHGRYAYEGYGRRRDHDD